jgi:hypothetical protein
MRCARGGRNIGVVIMLVFSLLSAGLLPVRDDAGDSYGVAVALGAASAWTTGAGKTGVFHHS